MKKIKNLKLLSQWPRPWNVLDYYKHIMAALKAFGEQELRAAQRGEGPFFGCTPDEVDAKLSALRDELEQEVTLLLAASFEAVFRVDLALRAKGRARDSHSKGLRQRFADREFHEVRFEEILDGWKTLVGSAHVLGAFKQVVILRHWLAHGRYWPQKSGLNGIDPYEVWRRGDAALAAVPILPNVDYGPPDGSRGAT